MLRRLSVVAAMAMASWVVPSAAEDDLAEVHIQKISLTTGEGIVEAYEKLQLSARRACRDSGVAGRSQSSLRRCQGHVLNQFVLEIDSKGLTQFHNTKRRLARER